MGMQLFTFYVFYMLSDTTSGSFKVLFVKMYILKFISVSFKWREQVLNCVFL